MLAHRRDGMMTMLEKTGRLLVVCLILGVGTYAFAGAQAEATAAEGEPVTISYWKAPHTDEGDEAAYWEPIIDQFMEAFPNVTVEHLITPWGTWIEKYTAAYAGGTPPDVAYMTEWYPRFAETGQLVDLSSRISDEMRSRYGPGQWDYATYNGAIIGVPFIAGDSIMFYNNTLLEDAGVEVPQTWEEFRAAARALTKDLDGDGEIDQWGTAFEMTPTVDIHPIIPTVYQAGATYLNEDQTALGFANDSGIRALNHIASIVLDDGSAPPIDMYDKAQLDDVVYKGRVALWIDQAQTYKRVLDNAPEMDLGATQVPAGPIDDPIMARANYGGIGLLSMSEAGDAKDAAWAFIEFLTQPLVESQYYSKVGFLAPNPATNELMYPNNPYMAVASEATQSMVSYPVLEEWAEIDTIVKRMLEEIFREAKSVEEAVMDADAEARRVLR